MTIIDGQNIRIVKGAKVLGKGKMVGLGMRVWYYTLEVRVCVR